MASPHGFTDQGARRIVRATRRVERQLRSQHPVYGRGPHMQEGCWILLVSKTEHPDSTARAGFVGAYGWKLVFLFDGEWVDDPLDTHGDYDEDPELDKAAYEVNKCNANLHLAGNNIVRARPGTRRSAGVQLLFDKGLTDEPKSLRKVV